MSYLLIAYKPSSEDYCRGCHMASYSSEFETTVCDSLSDLTEKIIHYRTWELSCGEEGFELIVFDKNFKEQYATELGIYDDIQRGVVEVKSVRKEQKKKAEQLRKEKQSRETRDRELKELQRLSEKYNAK